MSKSKTELNEDEDIEDSDVSISNVFTKKCRIRETPNLLTNAERSTNIFFVKKRKSIRNDSSFSRLYALVHKCTSPPVEDLPDVDLPLVQSETTPCF